MSGCARDSSDVGPVVIAPDLRQYSKPVQTRAAEELSGIDLPPCAAQQVEGDLSGCSALKLMLPHYLELRDKVRALRKEEP